LITKNFTYFWEAFQSGEQNIRFQEEGISRKDLEDQVLPIVRCTELFGVKLKQSVYVIVKLLCGSER